MDRLLFISLATVMAFPMPAQVFAQSSEGSYTIAGDVTDAQNFVFDAGQQVTVRDLLISTNLNQTQGNSFILRGQPAKAVWNEHSNPNMASQSKALQSGDVVVFRSLMGSQTDSQNVVLMTDDGNEILEFPKPSQLQVGQLFEVTQPRSAVTVVRTSFESAKTIQLLATDLLAHGDVIDVRSANAFGTPSVALAADLPAGQAHNSLAPNSEPNSGLTIPSAPQSVATTNSSSQPSPFDFASNATIVEEAVDRPFAVEDFDPEFAQNVEGTAVETQSAATTVAARAENASMWNALFVLGLVFASGLIVVGWVKTQQERRQELETSKQLRSSISTNNAADRSSSDGVSATSLNSSQIEFAVTADTQVEESEPVAKVVEPKSTLDITDELWVETEEATSSELPTEQLNEEENIAADIVDEDCPILSIGTQEPAQHPFSVEALGEHLSISEAEVPAIDDAGNQSEALANALVGSHEWFGADWRTAEAKANSQRFSQPDAENLLQSLESGSNASGTTDSFDDDDDDADVDDTVVEVREARRKPVLDDEQIERQVNDTAAELRSELEDLIHNRLPMNLQQIELPLRINLFGKPSGPKRLRIDSAHTQIAAPHMMSTAKTGRRSQSVAVSADRKSVTESYRTAKAPVPGSDSDAGLPGLDKALNFLDEQADS